MKDELTECPPSTGTPTTSEKFGLSCILFSLVLKEDDQEVR